MRRSAVVVIFAALAGLVSAQDRILGPYSAAFNLTADMAGKPDTRQGTWGKADFVPFPVHFHPPEGYRVRILRVRGDFIAFPKDGVILPGTHSEASWGLLTTAPEGSNRADMSADNCFLWRQTMVTSANQLGQMSYDYDVSRGGLLEPDNVMIVQLAVSINTTGLVIHTEPTFVYEYQFEK